MPIVRATFGAPSRTTVRRSHWTADHAKRGNAPTPMPASTRLISAGEVSAYRVIPGDGLLRALDDWLPDDAIRRRVLVDNPARLYDFRRAVYGSYGS